MKPQEVLIFIVLSVAPAFGMSTMNVTTSTEFVCTGKPDGDYQHPTDCTKFCTCSNGHSHIMNCGSCSDTSKCPDGKLHYSVVHKTCELPEDAQCKLNENRCDPENCKHEGYCTEFRRCNKHTSTWETIECGEDLFWDPIWYAEITGGTCNTWENLSESVREEYKKDPKCFPLCYYAEKGSCSNEFLFHEKDTDHRQTLTLSCPPGLLWNQNATSCADCSTVSTDSNDPESDACPCNGGA